MKNYEKLYKDALDMDENIRAKQCEIIFQELAESEDEKIRKDLIEWIDDFPDTIWRGHNKRDILTWLEKQKSVEEIVERCKASWYNEGKIQGQIEGLTNDEKYQQGWHDALEKQGEQNPANKVEPKFKVGDWIINNDVHGDVPVKIKEIGNYLYLCERQDGVIIELNKDAVLKEFKHWDISDAKDGDILSWDDSKCIALFKNIYDEDSFNSHGFVGHCTNVFESRLSYHDIEGVHPATKEQRDLLFAKMHEAGYMWDDEKKELKLLITNGDDFESENYDGEDYGIDSLFHAKRILEKTLGKVDGYQTDDGILEHKCAIAAVNKLYRQKPTWSEKDESHLIHCVRLINNAEGCSISEQENAIDWLKSLKQRYTWKPSEEQLRALHDVNLTGNISYAGQGHTLIELYNDLKKLK